MQEIRDRKLRIDEIPLIGPEARALIPAAVVALDQALAPATADEIDAAIGILSVALPQRKAVEDAERMLAVYGAALNDIPGDILEIAAMEAVKTLKFFPRVAELRELALPMLSRRKWRKMMLEELAKKHDEEYRRAQSGFVKPNDLARLRERIGAGFPSQRDPA